RSEGQEAQTANDEARDCFQQAFELSNNTDLEALEYLGHQQVRLHQFGLALSTFKQLENMSQEPLLRARALKFQAEIYECGMPSNLTTANSLLISAVRALPPNASDLEVAEIHEMHGRVRYQVGYQKAKESYRLAWEAYQRFIRSKPSREDV